MLYLTNQSTSLDTTEENEFYILFLQLEGMILNIDFYTKDICLKNSKMTVLKFFF